MNVTRHNFEEVFGDIVQVVEDSDFLSIDCEFTGLTKDKRFEANFYDTPEERYVKLYKGSLNFPIIQLGLCTFRYDKSNERYEARPYNFYIFSKPYNQREHDNTFQCQSSSIDFLVSQGFDFNTLFRDGIPYLTQWQELEIKEQIMSKHELDDNLDTSASYTSPENTPQTKGVSVPDEQKAFIENVCASIDELVRNPKQGNVTLDSCSSYQRKLIFEVVKSKYSSLLHLQTKKKENERYIEVSLAESEEDLKKKKQAEQDAQLDALNEAVGISRLMRVMSQSGKVIAGHNMLLDLLHMVHQFFMPLPPEYSDMKAALHCIFPRLIDTKLMASTHPFKDLMQNTSLSTLKDRLLQKPFTQPKVCEFINDKFIPESFPSYSGEHKKFHEAGYDAYMTGVCLITLKTYLGSFQNNAYVSIHSRLMQPFINKICLTMVCDIPYINLVGDDLKPSREHVFHVTFPRTWKSHDLHHLFSPYGKIRIGWINETAAFVGLHKRDHAAAVMKKLCVLERKMFKVIPSSQYSSKVNLGGQRKRNSDRLSDEVNLYKRRKSLNAEASPFVASIGNETCDVSVTHTVLRPVMDITDPATCMSPEPPLPKPSSDPTLSVHQDVESDQKMFVEPIDW